MKLRFLFGLVVTFLFMQGCENDLTVDPTFDSHFVKYYGTKGDQEGRDMVSVPDGYIIAGRSDSDDLGKQIILLKTDKLGNEVWSIMHGGIYNEDPASIAVNQNGELLVSSTVNYPDGTSDMVYYLFASDGNIIDSILLGKPSTTEIANEAIVLSDGSFLFLGTTDQEGPNPNINTYMILYRTTGAVLDTLPKSSFNAFWGQSLNNNLAAGVVESNSEFYVLGTSDAGQATTAGNNMVTFKLDDFGNIIIGYTYWGTDDEVTASKIVDGEQGFLLIGSSSNGATSSIFIQEISENFADEVNVQIGSSNLIGKDILDIGTSYIVLAEEVISPTDRNIYLCSVDNLGNKFWETRFGGNELDIAESGLIQDSDRGIVLLGTVDLENQKKITLIKVNDSGLLQP